VRVPERARAAGRRGPGLAAVAPGRQAGNGLRSVTRTTAWRP